MEILEIFGIFSDFSDFWGILGFLGILGILGILRILMEFLTEMCESDFFRVITDVSTKIWICQPKQILSANKAEMCGF